MQDAVSRRSGGDRIAHVSTSDLAIKYLLRNQLIRFVQAGYEVHAVSAAGRFERELSREAFAYESLPVARRINPPADLRTFLAMKRHFTRLGPQLVHTHTNKAGVLGCWAARSAGVPRIVSTVHGFYFHERMSAVARAAFIHLYRETFRFADRIFLQSAEDMETALRRRIARKERLVHIGNGIDLERFNPLRPQLDADAARLRQSIGVPHCDYLIGIISRINHEKGHRELLSSFRGLIHELRRSAHLVIVGDGSARPHFEELARRLEVASRTHFVGFRADIPEWLTAMDVFVLPSYREGFPRSLCEAFAMGTPAVATRIRGCRELIVDGESGLIVEPGDDRALCNAIDRLLGDASLRRRLADRAREHALTRLDEDRIIQQTLAVYEELGLQPACPAEPEASSGPAVVTTGAQEVQLEGAETT